MTMSRRSGDRISVVDAEFATIAEQSPEHVDRPAGQG